jgi:hypothetical protein
MAAIIRYIALISHCRCVVGVRAYFSVTTGLRLQKAHSFLCFTLRVARSWSSWRCQNPFLCYRPPSQILILALFNIQMIYAPVSAVLCREMEPFILYGDLNVTHLYTGLLITFIIWIVIHSPGFFLSSVTIMVCFSLLTVRQHQIT